MFDYRFKIDVEVGLQDSTFLHFLDCHTWYLAKHLCQVRDFSKYADIESLDELDERIIGFLKAYIQSCVDIGSYYIWNNEVENLPDDFDFSKLNFRRFETSEDGEDDIPF